MSYNHDHNMSATFVPGGYDDYYMPPPAPELQAPLPQRSVIATAQNNCLEHKGTVPAQYRNEYADSMPYRHMPEMSDQIQEGIANLDLSYRASTASSIQSQQFPPRTSSASPKMSPFPKLHNPPQNIPPSDEEVEATLENAREPVLNSNDPEMQLAWAQDTLQYVQADMDNEERMTATQQARPATPRVVHQLKADAINIVSFLAEQHHPKAEFMKGMWLEFGRFGLRQDKKEAFRCYSRSADRGYARSQYRIGMLYEASNDPIKALKHYHQGVDLGDSAALYRLGMMTLRGQHGQPQDFLKGVELIKRSAQTADENAPQGAYVYGMLLAQELPQIQLPDGVLDYDERVARINIEKAAYFKFAKAQVRMGSAYELCTLGCEFNPAYSLHYNALAAKQGEAEAEMALSKWFLVGHDGLFAKNEELAYVYAQRAAQSGLSTAEFAMGYFNEIGMYIPQDLKKAISWYEKASANGNKDASARLKSIAQKNLLSRKDHEKVAIGRIKSTYGSMRGQRPARFERQGSKLSTISSASTATNGAHPPRTSSITPYPADDRPPTVPPPDRPGTVTPYPLSDAPPQVSAPASFIHPDYQARPATTVYAGPGSRPGSNVYPNPRAASAVYSDLRPASNVYPDRPSSAFTLAPDIRPLSTATAPARAYNRIPSAGSIPYQSQTGPRPATVDPRGPQGRGQGQRILSGPAGVGYRPDSQPSPQPQQMQSQPQQPIQQTMSPADQRLDIGFSAPHEQRQLRPVHPAEVGRQPKTPIPAYAVNGNGRASARPMQAQRPGSAGRSASGSAASVNGTMSGGLPSKDPTPPISPALTAQQHGKPQPPPKKGPQTFAEMGIPDGKRETDCVVM